jgi:hypothetical protein
MRDVSQKVFEMPYQMPYGGMGRANVAPVITDLFKGRYRVETLSTTITCNTQVDLKATLKALDFQDTMIGYVFNELYQKGVCELKYKAITISDDEWKRTNGTYNPANEVF